MSGRISRIGSTKSLKHARRSILVSLRRFEPVHRFDTRVRQCLNIVRHRDCQARMSQQRLDHLIQHTLRMEIRCKASPQRVPSVPLNAVRFENWLDGLAAQPREIKRAARGAFKNIFSGGDIPAMFVQSIADDWKERHGRRARSRFCRAFLIAPHGSPDVDLFSVDVGPLQAS